MFDIGTFVLYGNTGVCEILSYETPELSNIPKGTLYYSLKPLFLNGSILCPVENSKIFIRSLLSANEVHDLLDYIPTFVPSPYFGSGRAQELTDYYKSIFALHDTKKLLELISSIMEKKKILEDNSKRLSQIDERYLKLSLDLITGEFSVVLHTTKEEIKSLIFDSITT